MDAKSAPFYITTPIYYVNGKPHIGHAYTTIAADVAARYHRLMGRDVRFLTGTDEHGQKVFEKAKERSMAPREHCDDMVTHWKAAWTRLDVTCDRFIRTTDEDHQALVTAALNKLYAEDLIYRDEYEGWYSVADEVFVTDKEVDEGRSTDDLERITEANYFFKMSNYKEALLQHIEAHPTYIQPRSRRNEVLGFLKKDLGDLCISRPKARMSWGIELPFDDGFVTYVWFDALLNYLTGAGVTPSDLSTAGSAGTAWPADHCLIGKDILTTHAVYFSTMLLALGVALPKNLFAHGWWTSTDGEKISKSKGNAISVDLLVEEFGVDATRFFLMREIKFGSDGGFSYAGFLSRYNSDLANDFGNLSHRAITMATRWHGSVPVCGALTPTEEALHTLAAEVVAQTDAAINALDFQGAIMSTWRLIVAGNKYVEETAPWGLNKRGETERLGTVIRHVLELVYLAAGLLSPVMPNKSSELMSKFGTPVTPQDMLRGFAAGQSPLNALQDNASVTLGEPLFPRFQELPAAISGLFEAKVEKASKTKQPKQATKKKTQEKAKVEPIEFADFMKVQLRSGKVLSAAQHPNADRLLVVQVDIGEEQPRNIVAGIADKYTPEALVGKEVVVVVNLKPAKIRGVMSEGMLLAAGDKTVVDLVSVQAPPGTTVR
jgi:methionyl-tRNA synthetase